MIWALAIAAIVGLHLYSKTHVLIGTARLKLRPGTGDAWIYNEVANDDTYRLRATPLPANPTILDIGAQIGIFSAFAASIYPTARIYAFEMDDSNFDLLRANMSALAGRVMSEHATVVGSVVPQGYVRNENESGSHRVSTAGLSIPPPITLAGILAKNRIARVDLLKMDIEGSEYDVLSRAAADGSLGRVDRIAMEWHDGRVRELVALLSPSYVVEVTRTADPNVGLIFARRR